MAHIWKVPAHHLLALCSLLNNLSLVTAFTRLQHLELSLELRWCFGVAVHFWLPKTEGMAALEDTTRTVTAASFLRALRKHFFLSGSDKDRTAKKVFNMTTLLSQCHIKLIIQWSPLPPPHKTLWLLNTLNNLSSLWQWQKIQGY